jgi:uncharacterized FAD-dependent dehydrogenase
MQKTLSLKVLPSEALNDSIIKSYIAQTSGIESTKISGYNILKRSIDARGQQPWVNLFLQAFINEPWKRREKLSFDYHDVHASDHSVTIIGAGPAGLFAALRLIEHGIKPIVLERGKDVRARRRDLALLNKKGIINPESNYCYGEGGAGAYSDGKLYTRSTKRGDVSRILNLFVHFGADDNILYESHPHIGTNKLPGIITAIRKQIIDAGGDLLFEKKLTDLVIRNGKISGIKTSDGDHFFSSAVILATGHSARDIFQLLYTKKITIESKPFALGVRIEHPQELINSIQYHCHEKSCDPLLPPASYSLVKQVHGTGVFSFCMCPGGIIAPASTNNGELVVNGWSPSKRNNPYANSGIVSQVLNRDLEDLKDFEEINDLSRKVLHTPLGMMYFQQYVERKAFNAGGGKFVAPAQRLIDFCENKVSPDLPECSYLPGIKSAALKEVLPSFIYKNLQQAFREFGRKMPARYGNKGFFTNEAIVVATESRTSSPVRVPRNGETLQHVQITNLYPCGEGAGYAGGIVSAAMDGEKVADKIAIILKARSSSK